MYTMRLKQNVRVAFVVRANNRGKGSFIQHLVDLIHNNDPSVAYLDILTVVSRRASNGSNNRMMDGNYPMRQFLGVLNDGENNDAASAETWGHAIAEKITDLNRASVYPTRCAYGGDLTPEAGPSTIDTQLINRDVVTLATHLYGHSIADGSFFTWIAPPHHDDNANDDDSANDEDNNAGVIPPVSADFFGLTDDPRSLFIGDN